MQFLTIASLTVKNFVKIFLAVLILCPNSVGTPIHEHYQIGLSLRVKQEINPKMPIGTPRMEEQSPRMYLLLKIYFFFP